MIGLVADDLTGACDSAVPFLRAGPVSVFLWPGRGAPKGRQGCLAISTETRSDVLGEEARRRTRAAVEHLLTMGAAALYKKVDSRLRGHVRAELEGVLEAWPGRVLLAPALPAEGRVTRGHRQLTGLEEVDLDELVAGLGRVEVLDATTDADLDAAAARVATEPDLVPAGSAGLAAAIARRLPARPTPGAGWPPVRQPLALVGSKTEVTAEQVRRALAAGWEVRRRSRGDPVEPGDHDALLLSGGGTAAGVLQALGAEGLDLLGEALPRVPVGRLRGGPHAGLTVALKSGGFGGPDAIDRALGRLCHRG